MSNFIERLEKTLISLVSQSSESSDLTIEGNKHEIRRLANALKETAFIDDTDQGNIGENPGQLSLKPGLNPRLLHLLTLMSLGVGNAINKLAAELIKTNNPSLVKALASSLKHGVRGAQLVLSQVAQKAPAPKLKLIKQQIDEYSPDLSLSIDKKPKPQFNPTPFKTKPTPYDK